MQIRSLGPSIRTRAEVVPWLLYVLLCWLSNDVCGCIGCIVFGECCLLHLVNTPTLMTRDWYSCLFIGSYFITLSQRSTDPHAQLHVALRLYTTPLHSLLLLLHTIAHETARQQCTACSYLRLSSLYTSISETKMAAAVAQPNEDVTASSYVGFDCKSHRSPPPQSATAMSSIHQSMEKLTPSHHSSNRAQAPKTRFPIQRNGCRYVPAAVSIWIELMNRSNWTGEINNDQHPLRITFDRIQRKDRT